jgi:hypothetical protein
MVSHEFGIETKRNSWCLKFGEERRLRVFENIVMRKVLGPKWEEATKH